MTIPAAIRILRILTAATRSPSAAASLALTSALISDEAPSCCRASSSFSPFSR